VAHKVSCLDSNNDEKATILVEDEYTFVARLLFLHHNGGQSFPILDIEI
jgi:hypothetical protein